MIDQELRRGKVCKGPELRFTPNGVAKYEFTIGQYANRKNDNGEWEVSASRFIRCVVWPGHAETPFADLPQIANQEIGEGAYVVVAGKEVTRQWEGNDGTKRSVQEFRVDRIYIDITQLSPEGHQPPPAPNNNAAPGVHEEPPF